MGGRYLGKLREPLGAVAFGYIPSLDPIVVFREKSSCKP